jgi:hypothetical protein
MMRSLLNLGTLGGSIGANLMDQSQNELRRAAAAAFTQSLNQLEQQLLKQQLQTPAIAELAETAELPDPAASNLRSKKSSRPAAEPLLPPLDLQALEEAAADIEELIQSRQVVSSDAPATSE